MENKTKDLYNPKDVQKVRDILIEEQDGMCKITGLELYHSCVYMKRKKDDPTTFYSLWEEFKNAN